jgi:uncharacterized protein YgbK (DUF1537 family)
MEFAFDGFIMKTMRKEKKIAIIADDLTGANDAGVKFANLGLSTIVLIGTGHCVEDLEETVIVVDTNSRALPPAMAYQQAAEAAKLFRREAFAVIYKKIDSTLRGNLGSEIDAIMDTCGQEVAIVAPAFPENGRATVGGYQLVHGVPLQATESANDPKCPVRESHLPTLLAGQTRRRVGHVGIKTVLNGLEGMHAAMESLIAAGVEIIVCDVWHQEQFTGVVAAATALERSLLWVGSAGLAAYLLSALGWAAKSAKKSPVVVIAGSMSNVTRGQVDRLNERPDVAVINVDPCALLRPESSRGEIKRCLEMTSVMTNEDKDVVIAVGNAKAGSGKGETRAPDMVSTQEAAELIAAALGQLCRLVVLNLKLSGLVLTGGDIALSCCSALSAAGLRVEKEVGPGIPMGILRGGSFDGLPVVTKAGAFGSRDALCNAVDHLKQRT